MDSNLVEFCSGTDQVLNHLIDVCGNNRGRSLSVDYDDNDVGFCGVNDANGVDRVGARQTSCT